jgi:hypothetical protein
MHFIAVLRASLVVIVIVASMVCNSDAAIYYVNGTTFFRRCVDFSIQAGTAVSFNGAQTFVATGNVGVSPGTAITGNKLMGTGSVEPNTSPAINCAADELIAYGELQGLTCTPQNTSSTRIWGV